MLTIVQIFNNNVALVKLNDNRQAIVKGKGIVFQKKKGQGVDVEKVEKIFYLETAESRENLYFLLKDIPIDIVTTTYEIVDVAQKAFDFPVLDYVYITLSDHIYGVYKRLQADNYTESLVPDMHTEYPTEYAIGEKAVEIISNNLHIQLPHSEAKSIALHFINAKGTPGADKLDESLTMSVNDIVQDILNQNHILRTKENGNYYDRLMVHLQYLVDRLNQSEVHGSAFTKSLEKSLEKSYPNSTQIAEEIYDNLQKQLSATLSDNEKLYFIIHIQRLINEQAQE
ncbi:PRD domain-containing protein [Pediococcus inopinatus]|uniref:PRD domain-containing protein n=1 Tax=Pediococcus inopinatus TaxID=114090 RepID=A0ABZ0Q4U1_9LACO|nr:PRD domain-containing protein [Pediococcus inopinatus]WPC20262.1 PRD domain-containing protein [Pediococcus inopinatus]WPC21967.1 PRD domain-containing protein [Pediococcus inopinatus]WPP09103.1 PRD domain-containing protein [Pediococcus inopinatus]